MINEMKAEEYLNDCFFINNRTLIDEAQALEYKKLVAKEAVKEFAASILNAISDLDAQNAIILELRKRKLM